MKLVACRFRTALIGLVPQDPAKPYRSDDPAHEDDDQNGFQQLIRVSGRAFDTDLARSSRNSLEQETESGRGLGRGDGFFAVAKPDRFFIQDHVRLPDWVRRFTQA